jgi:hypothetical protein
MTGMFAMTRMVLRCGGMGYRQTGSGHTLGEKRAPHASGPTTVTVCIMPPCMW